MENERIDGELNLNKYLFVYFIGLVSGIWGFLYPGRLALESSITLGLINIPSRLMLIVGIFLASIFILLGVVKDWKILVGNYFTIQSKHFLILGSLLVIFSAFTFIRLDVIAFFLYYYEVILITLYSGLSLFGISISRPSFIYGVYTLTVPMYIVLLFSILFFVFGLLLILRKSELKIGKWIFSMNQSGRFLRWGIIFAFIAVILLMLDASNVVIRIPKEIGFNLPSILILFFGIFIFIIGIFLGIKRVDLKIRRLTIPKRQFPNFLILGVVFILSTFFLASLYQPTYVREPGVIHRDVAFLNSEITWKNVDYQPLMEFNGSVQPYNLEYAVYGLVVDGVTVKPRGVVVNDSILVTIHRLPLSPSLIMALSDFYIHLSVYWYPLIILICGLYLLRFSTKKHKDLEPFVTMDLIEALEKLPPKMIRIMRFIVVLLGLSGVGLFLLITIEWIIYNEYFSHELLGINMEAILFQNIVGLFFLSLIIMLLIYLPKALRPFLDSRVLRYSVRRFLAIIPIFVGISIISYGLLLATGNPVNIIMSRLSPGPGRDVVLKDLIRIYGFNAPPQTQWFNWFCHFIMGDLGNSIRGGWDVAESISTRIGPTLQISILPLILTIIISIPLGIYASLRQYSWEDNSISIFVAVGLSMPIFLMIILLILLFANEIPILPPGGMESAWIYAQDDKLIYVYLFKDTFINSLIAWETWDLFFHLLIPVSAITLISLALYTRLVRSGYLEVIRQDFILSAQAYGFDERTIIFRHSLKNVMIPLVTYIGLSIGNLLGGAPITETTLGWPGLGRFAVTSIQGYDYPIVMGLVMVTATLILLANLLTDILYSIIDPRVTL